MAEKILIVDDDIDTLHLVGMMLQRQGYQIVASNTGRQALALLQSEKPDLVILDVMMPDMDGYEVSRQIRANPAISSTPIIMFTAKTQVDDKVNGYEAGVDDYITKPTLPRELFAHIKAVLERTDKGKKEPPPQPTRRAHVTGILSARGGLGNSTLAVNLGLSLHKITQKDVIVAELRPGEGSIGLDLGCSQLNGLARLLVKRPAEITQAEVQKEVQDHPSGLKILPASYDPQDAQLMQCVESIGQVTRLLAQKESYIILDLGPGIPASTAKILTLCNEVVVVLEPHPLTIIRSKTLIDEIIHTGLKPEQILPVLVSRSQTTTQLSPDQAADQLGTDILLTVSPSADLIFEANQKKIPAVHLQTRSLLAQQYSDLAKIISSRPPTFA